MGGEQARAAGGMQAVLTACVAREGSRALENAGGVDSRRSARRLAGAWGSRLCRQPVWLAKGRGRLRMQAVLTAGGAREDSRALEEAGGLDSLLSRRRWTARVSHWAASIWCSSTPD